MREQESKYREKAYTLEDIANDTIETSFFFCQSRLKGSVDTESIEELHQGIKQIKNYLLGFPYRIEEARLSAAKAAFVASSIIKRKEAIDLKNIRYADSKIQEMATVTLEGKLTILNKLKATQTEAFYYWWLISRM